MVRRMAIHGAPEAGGRGDPERAVILSIGADEETISALHRICAATGTALTVAAEIPSRAAWRSAGHVVIDVRQVENLVQQQFPRRNGVTVTCDDAPTATDLTWCLRLGVEATIRREELGTELVEHLGIGSTAIGVGRVIAVVGACGGAGASVFAAALAIASGREARSTVLVDCDRWGAGLDVVMGLEGATGVRWPDLAAPSGRLAPDALHRALPAGARAHGRVPVLTFDRERPQDVPVEVVEVVVGSLRSGGDTVVVDVPRIPSEAGDRVIELADLVVLVTPADVRGCCAAQRQTAKLRAASSPIGLVVRGPSPGGLGGDDLAAVLGVPLIGTLRPQSRISRDLEAGRAPGADPRSPFGRVCRAVLAEVDGLAR